MLAVNTTVGLAMRSLHAPQVVVRLVERSVRVVRVRYGDRTDDARTATGATGELDCVILAGLVENSEDEICPTLSACFYYIVDDLVCCVHVSYPFLGEPFPVTRQPTTSRPNAQALLDRTSVRFSEPLTRPYSYVEFTIKISFLILRP